MTFGHNIKNKKQFK